MSSKSSKSTPRAYSKTALDWFLANALFNEIEDGDYRSLEELVVKKGADPNVIIPEKGIAPIHLVTGLDDQDFCYNTLKLFLSHGGDPNSRSSDGMTPVHIAAVWGRTAILKLLLQHGGDPWVLDNESNNAFSYAHEEQHWETWRVLDDHKNSIIYDKPDKDRYRLKLECVKIYKNDLCAEYKADPVSSTCRSTQTVESFPGQILVNFSENMQLPKPKFSKEGIDLGLPVSELVRENDANTPGPSGASSRHCNGDNLFDMTFDELPEDQKIRAIRMVNRHRQNTDVIEYKPHVEEYDADEDISKSSIEENNDIGYASGSHTPTCQNDVSFSDLFKRNSKTATILNTGKDWMTNITQRKKFRNNLNKFHDSCSERLKLNVFTRRTNSSHDTTSIETVEKLSVSEDKKSKISHYSVTKSLKRVSSDFNRKLSLVFGSSSKHRNDVDNDQSGGDSEIYANRSCVRCDVEATGVSISLKEDRLSVEDVSKDKNRRYRASRSETILSNSSNSEVRNSFSNPAISERIDALDDVRNPVGKTNDISSFIDNEVEYSKNNHEFDMRMKQFFDDVLTEDESKSSQNFEQHSHACQISTETNESRISSSDNFFSCASAEESKKSDPNNCGVVNYNYSKNYLQTGRIEEMNGNINSGDRIVREYGWVVPETSGNDNIAVINEFDTSIDGQSFLNKIPGVVNSTPERIPHSHNDNFNDISKIPSTNINNSSVVNYSNPNVSDNFSVGTSGESVDLFESNIKASDFNGTSENSDDNDDVFESAIKSLSLHDSEVCNESLKMPDHQEDISEDELFDNIRELSEDVPANADLEVSITEEYLYTDDDDGIQLVEECHLPALKRNLPENNGILADSLKSSHKSNHGTTTEESESAVSSVEMAYETDELRRELREYGLMAGPITKGTKRVYLRKLKRFRRKPKPTPQLIFTRPEYCAELERILLLDEDVIQKWSHLEAEMCNPFQSPDANKRWREGVSKASFTYLLLDPRITQNLPARSIAMTSKERFLCFLSAIFYIGRGKRTRPYSHLYEALTTWNRTRYPSSKKVLKILDIWKSGQGVICLHVFQNVIPVEAMTREASMIDAMGLNCLTNEKLGDYYAVASEWTLRKRQQLGIVLLAKALNVFLAEGERQLRPPDISR